MKCQAGMHGNPAPVLRGRPPTVVAMNTEKDGGGDDGRVRKMRKWGNLCRGAPVFLGRIRDRDSGHQHVAARATVEKERRGGAEARWDSATERTQAKEGDSCTQGIKVCGGE